MSRSNNILRIMNNDPMIIMECLLGEAVVLENHFRAFLQGGGVPLLEGLPYQKGQNIALLYK